MNTEGFYSLIFSHREESILVVPESLYSVCWSSMPVVKVKATVGEISVFSQEYSTLMGVGWGEELYVT